MTIQAVDQSRAIPLPDLARLRLLLRVLGPIELPAYPGSTWRGLLGHGLRQAACVTGQPRCSGCLLIHGCVYAQVFETPPPLGRDLGAFTAMPHPFVLDIDPGAPRHHRPNDHILLGLTLIGPAIAHLPYMIHAIGLAGERGVGRGNGRFILEQVDCERVPGGGDWDRVYMAGDGAVQVPRPASLLPPATPEDIELRFSTPLRIKRGGRFVGPREFQLDDLMRPLHVRLHRLSLLYGGDPEVFEWGRVGPAIRGLTTKVSSLHWHDWTRYSSRQRTEMQMGGLLGTIVISGPGLSTVWPALWAGQWTHVGKGTAFGLGRYRLVPILAADMSAPDNGKTPQACEP